MPVSRGWGQLVDSSDRPEFVRVLNSLAAIRRVDLTEDAYELWWQSMKDWPIDDFKDAAGYLLKNCQFMPTPFDFEQLRKKSEPSAREAWASVISIDELRHVDAEPDPADAQEDGDE